MPDTPQWTSGGGVSDIFPGSSAATNDSWPVWAGHAEPGSTVKVEVDGKEYSFPTDENGAWSGHPDQALADGDHEFSMWTEKDGERSDTLDWSTDVQADSVARQNDYQKVKDWDASGAERHRERYRPATGGGAGSQTATSVGGQPGATSAGGGGGGFEKGAGSAVAVGSEGQSQPAGVEKGNKAPCPICGEERGDASPCPHCGMD